MTKAERKAALKARAARAVAALYHNATAHLWSITVDYSRFTDDYISVWFEQAAVDEIDYINYGGSYGSDYPATLRAPCNAGKYRSQAAQNYYVAWKMRAMQEERAKYAPHESIIEYGTLHQYGRGGATLAPEKLVASRGCSYPDKSFVHDTRAEHLTAFIRTVEAFNDYVRSWNSAENIAAMWADHLANVTANREEAAALEFATD